MTMKEFTDYNNRILNSVINDKSTCQTSCSTYNFDQLKSDYDFGTVPSTTKEPEIKIVRGVVIDPFMIFACRMATAKGVI